MTSESRTRQALTLFDFDDAVPLAETGMMSMPTMTEPAPEQMEELFTAGGQDVRVLFRQAGDHGCSLVWARFGPHYMLPRHSHYAYQAGPEGIEILEFRGATSFDMKISESLPRWERILEGAHEHRDTWAATAPVGR